MEFEFFCKFLSVKNLFTVKERNMNSHSVPVLDGYRDSELKFQWRKNTSVHIDPSIQLPEHVIACTKLGHSSATYPSGKRYVTEI